MPDETNYTKREIDIIISGITKHIDDTLGASLNRIEAQTIKTNGRVTKCEENIGVLKTSGKVANWAFGITVPIIMSMVVWIFFNQLQIIKNEMERHEKESDTKLEIFLKQFNLK